MHIQHNVMQLFHANSAPACTRSRSPHNVLHSPSYLRGTIFPLPGVYRTSCRKSLPARILRVLASCVISKLSSLPAHVVAETVQLRREL